MNRVTYIPGLIVGLMSMGASLSLQAQHIADSMTRASFVGWAKTHVYPLENAAVENDEEDLKPLNLLIGNARVVALGEPAHGFHETLSFRNRIFRFMVEHLGFNIIVLEAGLAESNKVADYIAGGVGNPEELAGHLTIGSPSIDDIELFHWMNEYNAKPEHKNKVKLYGMDMQIIGFPGDTVASHSALDEALAYLARVDPASAKSNRLSLEPFLNRLSVAKYPLLSSEEHDKLSAALDDLIATFEHQRIKFLSASSNANYDWAYRNAIVARQTDRMVRIMPPSDVSGKIPPEAWKVVNARDAAMAENVEWILEREGTDSRIFVYAHNAHVMNAAVKGGVWDAFAQPPNSAGQYLRSALGNKVVIIGTSFAQPASSVQPGSIDVALAQVGLSRFLLDLRPAYSDPTVSAWLGLERPMQANIVTFLTIPTSIAFDALLFIDKATATHRVKEN